MKITIDGQAFDVTLSGDEVTVGERTYRVRTEGRGPLKTVYVDEQPFRVEVPADPAASDVQVLVDAKYHAVQTETGARGRSAAPRAAVNRRAATTKPASVAGGIPAAMAGRVLKISVEAGQAVTSGDLLLIVEAMKMENELRAGRGGTVAEILVREGMSVDAGALLLVIQ